MKIKKFYLPVIILISLAFSASAFASAVLIDSKGSVKITSAKGADIPANTGSELPDGAKVTTSKNASASLMLMDGTIRELKNGEELVVGAPSKKMENKTVIEGITLAMKEATTKESGPTVHGMVKMNQLGPGSPKPALEPIGRALGHQGLYPAGIAMELPENINFKWEKDDKIRIDNPVIVIEGNNKEKLLVEKISLDKSEIEICSCKLSIHSGGEYSWYLASQDGDKILGKSRRFHFSILSEAEVQQLKKDSETINSMDMSEDGKNFLLAQMYFKYKMYDKMTETLLPLWKKEKTDTVKKQLFVGYTKMGITKEAMKYR